MPLNDLSCTRLVAGFFISGKPIPAGFNKESLNLSLTE